MSGTRDKDGGRGDAHRIDDEAKGVFLAAVKRGAMLEDAARAAGFTAGGFAKARKRDPAFDEAVDEALELSNAPRLLRPTNGRPLQLRRHRRLRFVGWRRELFLAHFAGTGNETEAAETAGVCTSTVYRHRVKDPEFAALHQLALEQCYVRLEAEAVRQRLDAQKRVAEALSEGLETTGELALEFDRVMKLLARWDRGPVRPGPRTIGHGRQAAWTFDEAIAALEKRLKSLGVPIPAPEPEEGGAP